MQGFPEIAAALAAVALLAGCTMAANGPGGGAPEVASAPMPLPDGDLTRTTDGDGLATLTVVDGRPVAYTLRRPDGSVYTAPAVARLDNGDIRIENARITGVQVADDSVSGVWRLGGDSMPVTFRL